MHMTATAIAATYPFSTAVALDEPLTDMPKLILHSEKE